MGDADNYVRLAAHELLEPLVTIEAFATLLVEGRAGEAEAQRIVRIARRTRGLVEALLMESRLDVEPLRRVPVALSEVFEAARDSVSVEAAARGVRLELGDLPTIEGDERLLVGLTTNLLLSVLRHGQAEVGIRVSAETTEDEVVITVGTAGVAGSAPAAPGVAGGPRRTTEFGLALVIAERIARRHGGRVTVEDAAEGGQRYVVALPL